MEHLSHIARVRSLPISADLISHLRIQNLIPDIPDESIYLWRAEISNELLDSHFTHMSERTLRNYQQDAMRGVAFLKGHDWRSLPLGYSIDALYESAPKRRVLADFYTVRGIPETDDLIFRMEHGLVRDVSVGFHGGEMRCDICGEDFWDCRHFPGLKYEVKTEGVVREVMATYEIDDARLSEVSGVYDGSTPDAMILKAQRHAQSGLLDTKQVEILENRYRINLPKPVSFSVVKSEDLYVTRSIAMEEKDLEKLRTIVGSTSDEHIVPVVEAMQRDIDRLKPLAEQGRQYHQDEVARAITEGIRFYGNDFDTESYKEILEASPLKTVQRFAADWKKAADGLIPIGRSTTDGNEEPPKKEEKRVSLVPVEAYQ